MPGLNLVAVSPTEMGDGKAHINNWPIRGAYLGALSDLGLSDAQIARYFHVEKDKVTSLRNLYRIAEGKRKA